VNSLAAAGSLIAECAVSGSLIADNCNDTPSSARLNGFRNNRRLRYAFWRQAALQ